MIVCVVVLYGSVEKCAGILGVGSCALWVFIIGLSWRATCVVWYVWLYIGGYIGRFRVVGLMVLNIFLFIDMWLYVGVRCYIFVVVLYGSVEKCTLEF